VGIKAGDEVTLGNRRGEVRLHARLFAGVRRGVLISEGIWPNDAFANGRGINTITGADAIAPYGGAAFHDNRVWIRASSASLQAPTGTRRRRCRPAIGNRRGAVHRRRRRGASKARAAATPEHRSRSRGGTRSPAEPAGQWHCRPPPRPRTAAR